MLDYLFAVVVPSEIPFSCGQFGLIADRQADRLEVTLGDDAIIDIVVLGEVLLQEQAEHIVLSVCISGSSLEESPRAQVPGGHPWPAHGLCHLSACGPYKYVGSIMFDIMFNLYLYVGFLLVKMVLNPLVLLVQMVVVLNFRVSVHLFSWFSASSWCL